MAKKPGFHRPVKRFKSQTRGYHANKVEVLKQSEIVIEHPCSPDDRYDDFCERRDQHSHFETIVNYVGKDPDTWVRFYPNPGYKRKNGNHWCRKYGRHPMPQTGLG